MFSTTMIGRYFCWCCGCNRIGCVPSVGRSKSDGAIEFLFYHPPRCPLQMQSIFYHNSSGQMAFTGPLKSREFHRAITLHPVKQHAHMYRIHNYLQVTTHGDAQLLCYFKFICLHLRYVFQRKSFLPHWECVASHEKRLARGMLRLGCCFAILTHTCNTIIKAAVSFSFWKRFMFKSYLNNSVVKKSRHFKINSSRQSI